MNRRLQAWREWSSTYWPYLDKYPELFPFICRMYALEFGAGSLAKRNPKQSDAESSKTTMESSSSKRLSGDILFVSHASRSNCAGVGAKLQNRIKRDNSALRFTFFETARNPATQGWVDDEAQVYTWEEKARVPNIWRLLSLFFVIYLHGYKTSSIRKCLFKRPISTWMCLIKITVLYPQIEKLLSQSTIKLIICPNEAGREASLLYPAAKRLGIKTIQYLHGTPSKLFWPFLSDEFWVWGDITQRMILGDKDDNRLLMIGSLEHLRGGVNGDIQGESRDDGFRILMLSQLIGDEAWGISSFRLAVERVERMCKVPRSVHLRIRPHPSEWATGKASFDEIFSNVPYEISSKSASLYDDVKWATHIYTGSSTAILAGVMQSKPSYLVWNDELDGIHGCPFFPEEYVIRNDEEMLESLTRRWDSKEYSDILDFFIGPAQATESACSRLQSILND